MSVCPSVGLFGSQLSKVLFLHLSVSELTAKHTGATLFSIHCLVQSYLCKYETKSISKAHNVGAISLTFNYELGWIEPIADNPHAPPGVCEW